VDGVSENPTADGQHDIRLQEAAVRAQPGDASSSEVWSWELDSHGRFGWQVDRVVPRGETSETLDPILQRGPPDLVVISFFGTAGIRRILRRGGQPRARPRFRNAVLTDRPQKHK